MTQDWIAEQLAEIAKSEEQMKANFNALAGAKQAFLQMQAHFSKTCEDGPHDNAPASAGGVVKD